MCLLYYFGGCVRGVFFVVTMMSEGSKYILDYDNLEAILVRV